MERSGESMFKELVASLKKNAPLWVAATGLAIVLFTTPRPESGKFLVTFVEWMNDFGWVLFGIAGVNYLFDLSGKRKIVNEIDKVFASTDRLRQSGISSATLDYNSVQWALKLDRAQKLHLAVGYAATWRANYVKQLNSFVLRKGSELHVVLPDPEDAQTVDSLARRFNREGSAIRASIREAVDAFQSLRHAAVDGSVVEVRFSSNPPGFAYYRIDNEIIVTLYHSLGRTGEVATLQLAGGTPWFDLFTKDFNNIWSLSREVSHA